VLTKMIITPRNHSLTEFSRHPMHVQDLTSQLLTGE